MTVRCEKEWQAVEKTLQRYNRARSDVHEILRGHPSTLDDLTEFMGARVIEEEARHDWEYALTVFCECADRAQASN